MTTMIDFPALDAAIDAESWQWLTEVYADAVAAEVERLTAELQNTTVDRDMALRYADVLKNERDALRAQLDAAGQYEIAHKLRTGDFEVVTAPPQD